ncbi:hypothetical protein [Salmonella enterica]|uniref:hypothetical protein n=1 Tax=Salmonella enterica TaxID=28901 RepID=UPI00066503C5|nr:hypothetical protein [Salmonella enterica subsp. enterica serovar Langford]
MASKNTIITHIGDDLFYELILKEAEREGKTKSEYVRSILMKELSGKLHDLKMSFNDRYSYSRVENGVSVFPVNVTLDRGFHYSNQNRKVFRINKVDDVLTGVYKSPMLGLIPLTLKGFKNNIKEEAIRILPSIIKDHWSEIESLHGCMDVNLFFVNRVDVSYAGFEENIFSLKIDIHYYMSRFPLDAIDGDDFLRLDFLNIRYLRFKNVAINGRLHKEYDRFAYIAPSKETLLGGFFVGLFYKPQDKEDLLEKLKGIIYGGSEEKENIINIQGGFVKYHCNYELVKVNMRTFSKEYHNLLEIRKELKKKNTT